MEQIRKPGGEDKVHGDRGASDALARQHEFAKGQGAMKSELKAAADAEKEVQLTSYLRHLVTLFCTTSSSYVRRT